MDVILAVLVSAIVGGAIAAWLAFSTPLGSVLRNPIAMLVSFGVVVAAVFAAFTMWVFPALGW